MYQKNDRLGGTLRVQRYKKYRIYANKINKKHTENNIIDTHTLPHYHTTTKKNVSKGCKCQKKALPLQRFC